MNIQVGDYVWCQDIEEYGFVEKMKDSLHPAYDDVVRVRMESDGTYRSYSAHTLVCANTDTSPMCESASDYLVEETDPSEENGRFDSPVSKEAWTKVLDDAMRAEVRQTSDSGAQKGSKLARYDMIPADALELVAEHYGKGAEKYPPFDNDDGYGVLDNWRRGYAWSLSFAAMMRHAWAFWRGEDIDPETGSPHLAAIVWHALTLLHWSLNPKLKAKYDDRPRM